MECARLGSRSFRDVEQNHRQTTSKSKRAPTQKGVNINTKAFCRLKTILNATKCWDQFLSHFLLLFSSLISSCFSRSTRFLLDFINNELDSSFFHPINRWTTFTSIVLWPFDLTSHHRFLFRRKHTYVWNEREFVRPKKTFVWCKFIIIWVRITRASRLFSTYGK